MKNLLDRLSLIITGFVFSTIGVIYTNSWADWPYEPPEIVSFVTSSVVCDLDRDEKLDVLIGVDGYNDLYCLNNNGNELWTRNVALGTPSYLTVADLDKDGILEILIEELWDGHIYCVDKEGNILWQYKFGSSPYSQGRYVSPAAADLNNDGNLEVVTGGNDKNVYCFDKNGQLLWKYETDYFYLSSPAIADLDSDGNLEILVRSYGEGPGQNIYCIDKNGRFLWKSNIGIWGQRSHPVVFDLDGDGNSEILISSGNRHLYCIDKMGQLLWNYETDQGDYQVSSPAIADLDSDGNLEIVFFAGDSGSVYCLNKDGGVVWKMPNNQFYNLWGLPSPVIADLDGDGYLEVLIGANDFRCIDRNGRLLWKYQHTSPGYTFLVESSPAVADLDRDGNLEIMFVAEDKLFCLNKDGQVFTPSTAYGHIDPLPWPMHQHDLQRSGLYDRTTPITPIVTDEGEFTSRKDQLYASWASEDRESGIREYKYIITEDSVNGNVVRDWTSTGIFSYVTAGGFNLTEGKTYYFAVKAKNGVGMWSEIGYSDGITVDTTVPTIPEITDEGKFATHRDQLYASWFSEERESGIREYKYKITEGSINGNVVRDWTSTGIFNFVTAGGFNLTEGKTYYFAVKAKNGAGMWSGVGYSDGITIETTKPCIMPLGPVTPPATSTWAKKGKPITFSARVTDKGSGIKSVWVEFTQPTLGPLSLKSAWINFYKASLPGNLVESDIIYSIKALDSAGNLSVKGPFKIKVYGRR